MKVVVNSINKFLKISKDTEQEFVSCLQLVKLPKKSILIDPSTKNNHAYLFQRVNLGYIASYLGMSHVTLCALRK